MLLRRITQHVKAQNWTAVAIDFVIVVVGVFIGIQVSNWNDNQALRAEEREIVLQLIAEARETKVRVKKHAENDAKRLAAALSAHEALKATNLSDEQSVQLYQDLLKLGPFEFSPIVTASLNRMFDADRLSLISNSELQLNISRYKEYVNNRLRAFENVGRINLDDYALMNDRLDFVLRDGERSIVSTTEELLADTILERRVGQFGLNYQIFGRFHESVRQRNQEYLDALTQYAEQNGWLE